MTLTTVRRDRACGVLLASAAGDALGAPYEFQPPRGPERSVTMSGGGSFGWEPGEWTDDTSMAIAIAEVAAHGTDLRTAAAQDQIVARWAAWAREAKDVGNQTRAVLGAAERAADRTGGPVTAAHAAAASRVHHERTGQSGGNGSLMRTAPVAIAFLDDVDGLIEAARAISALTHFDPDAGDACVLWCLAIHYAVLAGELDVRVGLPALPVDRRAEWEARIARAEVAPPASFTRNGWVVEAFQAAWSAIASTPIGDDNPRDMTFRVDHLRNGLDAAVRGGRDTDTVAAIAGGLLGGTHGATAVPAEWRRVLHGWPGLRARDLVSLATSIVHRGVADDFDYSYAQWSGRDALARHPYDDGLWLGGIGALHSLPAGVDAVVSLCRVDQAPPGVELIEVRLIDTPAAADNPNLDYVLADTVSIIESLRAQGRTVLLHCVQAQSRTPTVAALYGVRKRSVAVDVAMADIQTALPNANPNPAFRTALQHAAARRASPLR